MKSEQERIKKILRDELDKEAEKIIEEVESDESLKNLTLPEDLDAGLMAKIKQYEAGKAFYEKLSDKDKEAYRLGKEMQIKMANDNEEDIDASGKEGDSKSGGDSAVEENSDEKKVVKFRKRHRMAVALVAIVAVLVMGFGMTSIGGKPFIPQLFEQMLAGRENVNINSSNGSGGDVIPAENDGEEQAYQEIKNAFGFDAVQLWYLPKGTKFLESVIDTDLEEAYLLFNYEDNILEYRMLVNYTNKSFGYDMEDQVVEEFIVNVSDVPITVKRYKILDNGEEQFTAQFNYKNVNYMFNGNVDKAELEKIINNLKFF